MLRSRFMPATAAAILVAAILLSILPWTARAQKIDPRAPGAIELPVLGTMTGTIVSRFQGQKEEFGRAIWAVGDVNQDGLQDWVIQRQKVDTAFGEKLAVELLLYMGVRDGLPSTESGQRIGPSEIGAAVGLLAAGDWDGDGHQDLCVNQHILNDTAEGSAERQASRVVVYWGSANGAFSNDDTTHLSCGSAMWFGPTHASAAEFNRDGVVDLLTYYRNGTGITGGRIEQGPPMRMFLGHRDRARWGRDGVASTDDWSWWQVPRLGDADRVQALDHDGDGALDIAMVQSTRGLPPHAMLAVLYGRRDGLPDTNEVEVIDVGARGINQSMFVDVTGDRIPELVASSGVDEETKIYVGLKGQRLKEQFGSGDDPPRPGEEKWWGKPWAKVWLPHRLHESWSQSGYEPLFDVGDVGLDGVGDVAMLCYPRIIIYNGGRILDSLIDAMIYVPGGLPSAVTVLGDIDGSGVPTIAVGYHFDNDFGESTKGTVRYIKATRDVPRTGRSRRLPEGTDRPATLVVMPGDGDGVSVSFSDGLVSVQWTMPDAQALSIFDALGRELQRWSIESGARTLSMPLEAFPRGVHFIRVVTEEASIVRSIAIP